MKYRVASVRGRRSQEAAKGIVGSVDPTQHTHEWLTEGVRRLNGRMTSAGDWQLLAHHPCVTHWRSSSIRKRHSVIDIATPGQACRVGRVQQRTQQHREKVALQSPLACIC